jgi:hypothetical protein
VIEALQRLAVFAGDLEMHDLTRHVSTSRKPSDLTRYDERPGEKSTAR